MCPSVNINNLRQIGSMSATVFARNSHPVGGREFSDSHSTTSSSASRRIVRKPEERSTSRRSFSRTNSEKSDSDHEVGTFFVKMKFDKEASLTQMTSRTSLLRHKEQINNPQKKREPTPKPGPLKRKKGDDGQIESQLLIADLQNRLSAQREKSLSYSKRLAAFQKDIKSKTTQILQLTKMYEAAIARAKESEGKLQEMDKMSQETETSLCEPKGKLMRLKGTISQSRVFELESEIKKLKKQNTQFRNECERREEAQSVLMKRCEMLEKEISYLKLAVQQRSQRQCATLKDKKIRELEEKVAKSKSERENLLENMLTKRNKEQSVMANHISKLEIEINFLNRKKNEEIANLKEKKDKETHALRDKLSSMYHRQQSQKRVCRWTRPASDDEDIELELSPDHNA